jgi:hypothetical protein
MEKLLFVILLSVVSLSAQARLCSLSFLDWRFSEKNIAIYLTTPSSIQHPTNAKKSLELFGLISKKVNLLGELKVREYSQLLAREKRFKKVHKILNKLIRQKTISLYEIERLAYFLTPKRDPITGFFRATFLINLSKETKPLLEYRLEQLFLNDQLIHYFEANDLIKKDSAWEKFKRLNRKLLPTTKMTLATSLYFTGINQLGGIPLWIPSLNFLHNRTYTKELIELYKTKGIDKAYEKFSKDYKITNTSQKLGLLPEKGTTYLLIAMILAGFGYAFLFGEDEELDKEYLEDLKTIANKYPQLNENYKIVHSRMENIIGTRERILDLEVTAKAFNAFERKFIEKNFRPVDLEREEDNKKWRSFFNDVYYHETLKTLMHNAILEIPDETIQKSIEMRSPEALQEFDKFLNRYYGNQETPAKAG